MNTELLDLLEKLDAAATPAPWQPKCGFTNGEDADWTQDDSFVGWETVPDISADRRPFAKGADCHLSASCGRTHANLSPPRAGIFRQLDFLLTPPRLSLGLPSS